MLAARRPGLIAPLVLAVLAIGVASDARAQLSCAEYYCAGLGTCQTAADCFTENYHCLVNITCDMSLCGPYGYGCCKADDVPDDACEDGDPCTWNACFPDGCVEDPPRNCDDGDPCTDDSCYGNSFGCHNDQKNCDDEDPCTFDSCVEGACHHEHNVCDDHNPCSYDSCNPDGTCNISFTVCDDGEECTIDSCNSQTGVCSHVDRANGAHCPAGNVECQGGECQSGTCQFPTTYEGCPDDGRVCTSDFCRNGECVHEVPFPPPSCTAEWPGFGPCYHGTCEPGWCAPEPYACAGPGECASACYDPDSVAHEPGGNGTYRPHGYPPAPPAADDHTFLHSYESATPTNFIFDIDVDRYAGLTEYEPGSYGHETLDDGFVASHVSAGRMRAHAELTIPMFGVNCPTGGACTDTNRVFFNGRDIAEYQIAGNNPPHMTGECDSWSTRTFLIPIQHVRFPSDPGSVTPDVSPPFSATNRVEVRFDNAGDCRVLAKSHLRFWMLSPMILVHGTNSDSAFWIRQGFTTWLDDREIVHNNFGSLRIDLATAPRRRNADLLAEYVPSICIALGVDSVHLVAHSKGGLDTRDYLERHYTPRSWPIAVPATFDVLSLTTLSTPHNGSALADLVVNITNTRIYGLLRDYPNLDLPIVAMATAKSLSNDQGIASLTTWDTAAFNQRNIPQMSRRTAYNAAGGNADFNGDWHINAVPDEFAAARLEMGEAELAIFGSGSLGRSAITGGVDLVYQFLQYNSHVRVSWVPVAGTVLLKPAILGLIDSAPPINNDLLVTARSAHGAGSYAGLINDGPGKWLFVPSALNHANVADGRLAAWTVLRIVAIEQKKGDLKRE